MYVKNKRDPIFWTDFVLFGRHYHTTKHATSHAEDKTGQNVTGHMTVHSKLNLKYAGYRRFNPQTTRRGGGWS